MNQESIIKNLKFIFIALSAMIILSVPAAEAADFNANNIISDGEFINKDSMAVGEIQRFLEDKGSFLKDFSDGGRSAAQIIYDASHGYNEASGSINSIDINTATGTINPKAILVTLQKEQSLISRTTDPGSSITNKAMGYGCPDGGSCSPTYAGFTKQVEWGAWQLRYNYERASGKGFSDYQVNQSMTFSDWNGDHTVTFDNRATSALYRYTPHVYNGNYNFWNLYFNTYQFEVRDYSAGWVSQSGYPTVTPGGTDNFSVTFQNNGNLTWNATGTASVHLAVHNEFGWASEGFMKGFRGSNWLSSDRVAGLSENIAPGSSGTFSFTVAVPANLTPGDYYLAVRLVAEGYSWFDKNQGAWWRITVVSPQASWLTQSGTVTAYPSQTASLSVTFTNSGATTWSNSTNPIRLAVHNEFPDSSESFLKQFHHSSWLSDNRIGGLSSSSVASGSSNTFDFTIIIPSGLSPGTYKFAVRLVSEGYQWLSKDQGAWWYIIIPNLSAQWVNQSSHFSATRGETVSLSLTMKNTSGVAWNQTGTAPIHLAVHNEFPDSSEAFLKTFNPGGWLSSDRIARMNEAAVANNATATFDFQLKIPATLSPGTYKFAVRLVSEGYQWLSKNQGAWWEINVN